MGYLGLRGQGEYNHVSEMLGTGKPETINYIQDPALLTSISYDQDPEALRAFMAVSYTHLWVLPSVTAGLVQVTPMAGMPASSKMGPPAMETPEP